MNRVLRKCLRACHLYDAVVDLKTWLTRTEPKYVRFYSQFVKEGDLCFDVGANVGRRTGVLLKLRASVIAVEPLPHCMGILRKKYANNSRVVLVQEAVGEAKGEAQMMVSDSHSLSSLSENWVDSVKASGRHATSTWNETVTVPVTTLDDLISQYGLPAFMKIDVEGYEHQALKGLSQPVKVICFEFTPEFIDSALKSVRRLSEIGPVELNYSFADKPPALDLESWVGAEEMCDVLASVARQGRVGDVYAKFDL